MNQVFISAEEVHMPAWSTDAGNFAKSVMEELGLEKWILSMLFCSNRYIKSLNSQYRTKDEATDVLSFSLGETDPDGNYLAGDIVISIEALEENSRFFKVDADEELRRLIVHGILHLSGKDHVTNKAGESMLEIQEGILLRLKEKAL